MEIPVVFLNLENKTIPAELNENSMNLFKFMPKLNTRTIALIDEIQYLKDPSNFLRLQYDEHSEQIKVVATGSSAFYIDNQFRGSLAGRKKYFNYTLAQRTKVNYGKIQFSEFLPTKIGANAIKYRRTIQCYLIHLSANYPT